MTYSGAFAVCNIINVFLLSTWNKQAIKTSHSYFVAAVSYAYIKKKILIKLGRNNQEVFIFLNV